jgi:putative cell wall-binding protein
MIRRILAAVALVAAIMTSCVAFVAAPATSWTRDPARIAGTDRFDTAIHLADTAFPNGASNAVLVSGLAFADGLAAGPLAARLNGPVLLTQPDYLPMSTAVELQHLGVTSVTVVGGQAAVNDDVITVARDVTQGTVERIAGNDRYETAAAVASRFPPGGAAVYVANGLAFADALTGGAAAATAGVPLVLVDPNRAPATVLDTLRTLQPAELRVLGGQAAVSDATMAQLQGVVPAGRRIAGGDRYATAAAVATDGGSQPGEVLLATGDNFPDALAAAPLSSLRKAPILLTALGCAPAVVVDAMRATNWPNVTMIGGAGVVTDGAGAILPCSAVPDIQINPGVGMNTQVLPGPIVIHTLTIDRSLGYDVRAVTATGRLQGVMGVTGIARRTGAIAAVNGDFFLGNGEPDHGLAVDGRLLKFPGDVNTIVGFDPDKPTYGLYGTPVPTVQLAFGDGTDAPLAKVNNGMPSGDETVMYTPEHNVAVDPGTWCRAVLTRTGDPTLDGQVTVEPHAVTSAGCSSDPVPRANDVLIAPPGTPSGDRLAALVAGATVDVRWSLHPTDRGILDAIGANITLVFGGKVASDVTGNSGPFYRTRAARTAVAQRPDGTMLLITVDRATNWSIGMTPREFADYLVGLGVLDAANLDGGGSTAMAVNGLLVGRPSDGVERRVATALVVVPHGADPAAAPPAT